MQQRAAPADATGGDTLIRRFLLWMFRWPATAYFTFSMAVDVTEAQAYLRRLAAGDGPRVTLNHLVAATIGRTLTDHPAANGRIIGRRIVQPDHVGVAMPVSLIGHSGGKTKELSMAVVANIDTRTLRDIAQETTRTVAAEREGKAQNPFVRWLTEMGEALPTSAMHRSLDGFARAMGHRPFAEAVYKKMPATTALTNPGATFKKIEGAVFRGGAFTLPSRGFHLGTVWGLSAIQDEVIAVNGAPEVRPMLPVMTLIDHRLIDGVRAASMLLRFVEIMQAPEEHFGTDGRQKGPGVSR
jgi:pyruvate/2-oxoglutarate dehydrogenase complex dihydrolipoamide acyltransferase (E2) component